MARIATLRTQDVRGMQRMIERILDEGYAVHVANKGMFNNREIVAFDGCYRTDDGEIITVDDVPERNRPDESLIEVTDDTEQVVKLGDPVTIEFVDADAKEVLIERFRQSGYALDPHEERGHGHGRFTVFSDEWTPAESDTVTVDDVPEEYQPADQLTP